MNGIKSFWRQRTHYLDRMTLRELIIAYFQYPAVIAYILLLFPSTYMAVVPATPSEPTSWPLLLLSAITAILVYPAVWYLLHRYVLHGQFLYRSPFTAALWKRIHYDHHQDPNNLRVLFGALYTTLPTVAIVTLSVGNVIAGYQGAAAAFAAGLGTTLVYEFCHCIQHLHYVPKLQFLRKIKRLHLLHHFHNEQGNYGITNYFWDKIFHTFYGQSSDVPTSPTVFNLGYAEQETERYPWVAQLSKTAQ
ncbi:MAG: sterol desaturase family protein [Nitrospirales bacterium]|nr:sterol desaturase family protein [Nitrospira sp.]MDR4503151.1 sterol desaturase family protein [Nitrospirales bacterium]